MYLVAYGGGFSVHCTTRVSYLSYDKLWKILIDKKMKKYQLREQAHISSNSVAKLSKDELVSMEVLMKICETLECDIGDICGFYNDSEEKTDA